ncbi:MAG: glycosyltransferase family 87 protein, partial [Gemmataceae bacterium]
MSDSRPPILLPWQKILLGVFVAVLVVLLGIPFVTRARENEMEVYLIGTKRFVAGEKVHRYPSEMDSPLERAFTYPALFAVPFVPILNWPKEAQGIAWYAMNLAALRAIFWVLIRRIEPMISAGKPVRLVRIFGIVLFLMAARHMLSPLENQSHDLLVFAACAIGIEMICRKREWAAGIWVGLGAALKCTPLLYAPIWVWQRRWAAVASMLIGGAAFTFLPDAIVRANDGKPWIQTWYEVFIRKIEIGESAQSDKSQAWDAWTLWNQSIPGTFHRLFTFVPRSAYIDDDGKVIHTAKFDMHLVHLDRKALKYSIMVGQLAVLGWLTWICRRKWTDQVNEAERPTILFGQMSAVLLGMVLLSPTSIKTHFAVMLFPMAFCLADYVWRKRDRFVGAVLLMQILLGTLTAKGIIGTKRGDLILSYGTVTWCAIGLLLATGHIILQRAATKVQATSQDQPET